MKYFALALGAYVVIVSACYVALALWWRWRGWLRARRMAREGRSLARVSLTIEREDREAPSPRPRPR